MLANNRKLIESRQSQSGATVPGRGLSAEDRKAEEEAEKRITDLRRIDPADIQRYRAMIGPKGLLIKLFPDHDCGSKLLVTNAGECAEYVDGSAAYTFRDRTYADPLLSPLNSYDIYFDRGVLVSKAPAVLGVLVSLGDVPMETVGLTSPGVDHLVSMVPPASFSEAKDLSLKLDRGIAADNHLYTSNLGIKENGTYALRVMAYDQLVPKGPDKREDLLMVFRVVRRNTDGSVLLACKELQRKSAPKLRSKERGVDFQRPF